MRYLISDERNSIARRVRPDRHDRGSVQAMIAGCDRTVEAAAKRE